MRHEKTYLLDEIKEKVEKANAIIITKYDALSPKEAWGLREKLNKNSSELEVVKKRLLLKALESCGYKYDLSTFEGNIAAVFIQGDAMVSTKLIFEFGKSSDKLSVIAGEIDGVSYSQDGMEELSKLPSKDELRAQFVGLLEAPMSQTLSVIDSVMSSMVTLLDEKKKLEEKK